MDDDESTHGKILYNYPVLGGLDDLSNCEGASVVCAIANVNARKKIIDRLSGYDLEFATLIDPSVIMAENLSIGEGTIICAGSIVSVDVKIGNHVIVDWDSTIGHDNILPDYVTLYPSVNISGCCEVEECVEFGTGMRIIQGLRVTSGTVVGAGATVVRSINEPGTYVGTPAEKIK